MKKKEARCSACGFDKNAPRKPVILDNNEISFAAYEEDACPECGHAKDGSTIEEEARG